MVVFSREIKEGLQTQGVDEKIAYTLTTTPWGITPTDEAAAIFSVLNGQFTDVTDINMTGDPSVNGDIITLPVIDVLIAGTMYRVEVLFTCSGNVFEAFAYIKAEK